jgi:hypothetical protein
LLASWLASEQGKRGGLFLFSIRVYTPLFDTHN